MLALLRISRRALVFTRLFQRRRRVPRRVSLEITNCHKVLKANNVATYAGAD